MSFGSSTPGTQTNPVSNTLPPNSPSSSNSTSSPGFNSFPTSTIDKAGMSGQISSPSGGAAAATAGPATSSHVGVNPYTTPNANLPATSGMEKLTSSSYGHYAATVGATSVPEWYQQMGYHQYYAQGGDPYGLNNSQVSSN